jgi:hypothetical protein
MNSAPSPETVIERTIVRMLARVRVALPGVIESYDPTRCEASVQVQLLEPDRDELGQVFNRRLPVIPHAPVYFPGGGGARDTWPVQRGDTCLVICCSSSIARWMVAGGEVDPGIEQPHHQLSDAIVLVGLTDFGHAAAAHASARVIEASLILAGSQAAADPVARKSDLDAVVAKLNDFIGLYNTHTNLSNGTLPPALAFRETSLTAPACSSVMKLP